MILTYRRRYVISNYDGIGEPLFPRPTTTEARRGIQQLGKGLFKHPKKVDEKYEAGCDLQYPLLTFL